MKTLKKTFINFMIKIAVKNITKTNDKGLKKCEIGCIVPAKWHNNRAKSQKKS